MKFKAPIITLLAGLVIAGVLLVLNLDLGNDAGKNTTASDQAASPTSASPSAPPATDGVSPSASQPAGPQETLTYAGSVDGGKASLAIVVKGGKAIAYLCDGKSVEAWLSGSAAVGQAGIGGQASLGGPKGGLTSTFDEGKASGTVTAAGTTWTFSIKAAAPPSGLYRSSAALRDRLDASWVVTPDGRQVGVQKRRDGSLEAAPPFDTGTNSIVVDGVRVPVEAGSPGTNTTGR